MASMGSVSAVETSAEKASAVLAIQRHWRDFVWRSTGFEKAQRACQNLKATGNLKKFWEIRKNLQEFGNREVNAAQHKLHIANRVLAWPNGFDLHIASIANKVQVHQAAELYHVWKGLAADETSWNQDAALQAAVTIGVTRPRAESAFL
jgi:hypothetical protein